MPGLSRRRFLRGCAIVAGSALSGCHALRGNGRAHVVIVGGGFGGATAAKTLRMLDAGIKVTLIEPKARYITCPASNWLFAGLTDIDKLTVEYRILQNRHGVELVMDSVLAVEPERRRVRLAGGQSIGYDRLIMSPGIDFRWDAIEGYDQAAAQSFPHAWVAGAQTLLLANQLRAMPDGGVVLIAAPPEPYRCPPGPYERASMMAHWLKQYKPRSKIIILDPKRSFSKQALFEAGWARHYGYGAAGGMIEWHSLADNPLIRFDSRDKTLVSDFGDRFAGDVLNIIPPQSAGRIAVQSGLADASGWCPVNPLTGQSVFDEFIHVIGDAARYEPIPKSAFAANSEAKVCATAVVGLINQRPIAEPSWVNTCYSLLAPRHGISVAGVYKLDEHGAVAVINGAGGISSSVNPAAAELEAGYARAAYRSLVTNSFN